MFLSTPTTRVAATGTTGFVVAAAITGFLTPGYQARREAISALAARDNDHAWLMIAGFVCAAVGLVAAAASIWSALPHRAGRVGAALAGLAALGIGVAGFARQDCSERLASCIDHGDATGASTSFWVHQQVSMLSFALLVVAAFCVARGLRRSGLRDLAVVVRTTGAACLVCVVLLVTEPASVDDHYGLVQRLFVLLLLGWPLATALTLTRSRSSETTHQKEHSRA